MRQKVSRHGLAQLQNIFHHGGTEGTEVLFFYWIGLRLGDPTPRRGDADPAKDHSPAGMQQIRFSHYVFTGI